MNQQLPARTVRDYLTDGLEGLNPAVTMPDFEAEHFKLKPVMFNMLNTLGQIWRHTKRECKTAPQVFLGNLQFIQDSWSLQQCLEAEIISLFTEG
ncbi:hypothetical protein GQ457_HM001290 [Hibiscus cannabinus]